MKNEEIINALNWRYATKVFDPTKKVSDEDIHTILESARLAPSSVGLEPWKFLVVENVELRQKMRAAGYDQTKITDASHLVVIARRTDTAALPDELIARAAKIEGKAPEDLAGLKKMAEGGIAAWPDKNLLDQYLARQTYIPLGTMVETAALLNIDNCPMEGFDPEQIAQILGLSAKNLYPVAMIAFGYRGDDAFAKIPKVRRSFEEVVEFIA
jgi:nitroreductase